MQPIGTRSVSETVGLAEGLLIMRPGANKRKKEALADRFTLEEAFLASPDKAALKSAVIRAVDRESGEPLVLKYWEKTGSEIDADLRDNYCSKKPRFSDTGNCKIKG